MNKWNTVSYPVIFHVAYYCWRNVRNVWEKVLKKKKKTHIRFRVTFVLAAENELTNLPRGKERVDKNFNSRYLPFILSCYWALLRRKHQNNAILSGRKTKTHFIRAKISQSPFHLQNEIALIDTELKLSHIVEIFKVLYGLEYLKW